jgi:hypothetical protein
MSQAAIRRALETALAGMTPELSTAYENLDFKPTEGVAYQQANFLFAEPENPEMGDTFTREQGIFQILLKYPQNKGSKEVDARADLIKSVFHKKAEFTNAGITVTIERTPAVFPGYRDTDRWVVPVRVRFYSNIS